MPEGDSYARAAHRLRAALSDRILTRVDGTPSVRRWSDRLVGRRVEGVRTHGKHLLVDVEGGVTIHVWLGMPGRWRIGSVDGRWVSEGERPEGRGDPGAIRLVLATDTHTAVCYSAPTVEVDRREVIDRSLRRLGPDVLGAELDIDEVTSRARLLPIATPVADVLLDQRVMAGIGNEYKNEILFLEGIHPLRTLGSLEADGVARLARQARRLMAPNARRRGQRSLGRLDGGTWVFERTGLPCRRCRTAIVHERLGTRYPRATYWCPRCQPDPTGTTPGPSNGPVHAGPDGPEG